MGSGYDEVAKAIATNVPRRKILKLMAGGVAASIGSALIGGTAAAKQPSIGFRVSGNSPVTDSDQVTTEQEPVINGGEDSFRPAVPWWSAFYPGRNSSFGINGSGPF